MDLDESFSFVATVAGIDVCGVMEEEGVKMGGSAKIMDWQGLDGPTVLGFAWLFRARTGSVAREGRPWGDGGHLCWTAQLTARTPAPKFLYSIHIAS